MPLPKPHSGEEQDAFIERCMGTDVMKEDYPDNKQRLAVCFSQWKEKKASASVPIEHRTFTCDELRAESGEKRRIIGHAAVFDTPATIGGGWFGEFVEQVSRGAFTDSLKTDDIRALFNHNADYVLGRNKAGTLRLSEDGRGLAIEIDPPDTQVARDLMISIERGDITQMSFGFQTVTDEWDETDPKKPVRTLKKVRLFDVSPVTYPAYEQTDVELNALRSRLDEWRQTTKGQATNDPGNSKSPSAGTRLTRAKLRLQLARAKLRW